MKRWWLTLIILLTAASASMADSQPLARVIVRTPQPVLIGQQVEVDVQILAPNFFMSAPDFPIFDMPGAIVTMPNTTGTNFSETIGGQGYAGIQKSYVVTPQAAGSLTIPPIRIAFRYAAEPGKATDGAVTLPPQKIVVAAPASVGKSGSTVPVARITITQSLDRQPAGLKAGDALVRTVTIAAEGMQAMMIPPPAFEAPPGVRLYRKDPMLSDGQQDRQGFKGGDRTDQVTYVFERPGAYTLPAVTIEWFDAAKGKRETARADEIRVSIAQDTSFKPEIAPGQQEDDAGLPQRDLTFLAAAVVAFVVLAALAYAAIRWLWPRFVGWLAALRRNRQESERAYFRKVEAAFANGDRLGAYRALDAWTRRCGFRSIGQWSSSARDIRLTASLQEFERTLFGAAPRGGGLQDAEMLLSQIGAARRTLIARRQGAVELPALPPLNP